MIKKVILSALVGFAVFMLVPRYFPSSLKTFEIQDHPIAYVWPIVAIMALITWKAVK